LQPRCRRYDLRLYNNARCTIVLIYCYMSQLTMERDEHKLVIDQLSTLESERKAFRLIGGILVEKTVGEALPAVQQNYEGV
jgi:prefoldin subunit 2